MPGTGSVAASDTARVPRRFPSFCEFVDDALFHPDWGYYSTGGVRFGTGGHYDTYPLALSPLFGRMIARYAFRAWQRAGGPPAHEICEIGAGNGQLCLDTLLWIREQGRRDRTWKRFADRMRYRILERSPALAARQRHQLGPLAAAVRWGRADLARSAPRGVPFAAYGTIVANEVFDCLSHHKIVAVPNAEPAAVCVVAELGGRTLDRDRLAAVMVSPDRRRVRFHEVTLPISRWPRSATFVARHYPELFAAGSARPPCFAGLGIEALLLHAFRLYDRAEALWIDYGETRDFHLRLPESRRVFAGPPRSRAGVYDEPGRHDITFLVDFSVAMTAARAAGWTIAYYGAQGELARRTRVTLDRQDVDLIVRQRALGWLLALVGVGPERSWQRNGVSWSRGSIAGRVPVRRYVERAVREFLAENGLFKIMITRK
jgi:SAM-dependent MidA family methyltransferase